MNGLASWAIKEKYFSAGLKVICVMNTTSLMLWLQGGIVPKCFDDQQINELFDIQPKDSICMQEVARGLKVFGLKTIFNKFPLIRYLFYNSSSSSKLTPQYFLQTFVPEFSHGGSTARFRKKKFILFCQIHKRRREWSKGGVSC